MPVEVYKGDKIYSGCINLSGVLEARVTRIYKDSIVSRIMETVEEAQNRKSQKEAFVTKFSKVYAPIMVLLSVLIMVIPPSTFSYGNWETWIYKGLIFIIVACPCALASGSTTCIFRWNCFSSQTGNRGQRWIFSGKSGESRYIYL